MPTTSPCDRAALAPICSPDADILVRLHSLPPTALLTPFETGLYINARTDLLRAWRSKGCGPTFEGRGHFIRYRKSNLDKFLAGHSSRKRPEWADGTGNAT